MLTGWGREVTGVDGAVPEVVPAGELGVDAGAGVADGFVPAGKPGTRSANH